MSVGDLPDSDMPENTEKKQKEAIVTDRFLI